ncbi:unnamed protein product [Boreogadus saida]
MSEEQRSEERIGEGKSEEKRRAMKDDEAPTARTRKCCPDPFGVEEQWGLCRHQLPPAGSALRSPLSALRSGRRGAGP